MITKTGLLMVHLMQAVMQVGREAIKMSTIEHDNHEKMIKILRFPACSLQLYPELSTGCSGPNVGHLNCNSQDLETCMI